MRIAAVQSTMEPGGVSEQEVLLRARAGDEEAFRMLMDRHRDRAFAIALRITRSPADAEDVVQQSFVRAWHHLASFRADSAFGTWLHAIVARRALDRASQLKLRREREDELDAATELAVRGPETRDVLLIRRLERLMQRLSAPQRAVVTLFYWEDASVDEIARMLAMPENTVKTHLSRARAALRDAWQSTETSR